MKGKKVVPIQAIKLYGEIEVQLHSTSALDARDWSVSCRSLYTPGDNPIIC